MEEKPFSYFQNRVREKIADFERYEFGKRENGNFSKAEILNILQELIRESNTKEESVYFSKAILLEHYGYETCIYYLKEEKNLEKKAIDTSFWDSSHNKDLPDEIKIKTIQGQTIISSKDNTEGIFPIRGKATIQHEINYPSNDKVIIGALEVKSPRPLDPGNIFFLEKYCRRLGMGIHFFNMLDYNKRLNQHIIDMLTVASHDIRGPLNSIALGLKVLEKELYGKLDSKVKEVIKGLYKKAHGLSLTLETYLGETSLFSGYIEIKKEKLDFRMDIIDPILEEFSETFASNNITIDESMGGIPDGSISINADRIWLLSVYRNLFSNVVKYGGPGCAMAFGFEDWGDHYRLNVFNTGCSLDHSEQKKLFQKFSRIKGKDTKSIKGAGLGLYFAKEIIESHGGKIWYEPKPDGSNFIFTLPKD
jgi:signal transduction histidine kinase